VPWKVPWIVAGTPMRFIVALDRLDAVAQRDVRRQVERDGAGDEQALMIDGKRRRALGEARDRRQRHHRLGAVLTAEPVEAAPRRSRRSNWSRDCGRHRRRPLFVEADCPAPSHRARDRIGRLRTADRPARGADIDLLQRLRILPEARRDLHDDVVLVAGDIDGRDLALAEGVVERVVDLRSSRCRAVRQCRDRRPGWTPAPCSAGRC
jgi:hypothetical protein